MNRRSRKWWIVELHARYKRVSWLSTIFLWHIAAQNAKLQSLPVRLLQHPESTRGTGQVRVRSWSRGVKPVLTLF